MATPDAAGPGPLTIVGPPGPARLAAVVARAAARADELGPEHVIVVCATPLAARQLRDRLVAPVTVLPPAPFAASLAARVHAPETLAAAFQRGAAIRRLLAVEGPDEWPARGSLVTRAAFAAQVAAALDRRARSGISDAELLRRAGEDGCRPPWEDLLAFAGRLERDLAKRGLVDERGALDRAHLLLRAASGGPPWNELVVIVDDADQLPGAYTALLAALEAAGTEVTTAGAAPTGPPGASGAASPAGRRWDDGAGAGRPTGRPTVRAVRAGPPAERRVVTARHATLEPDAVAGALLAARQAGGRWSQMAVGLARPSSRPAVAAALRRHGIPAQGDAGPAHQEPLGWAVLDAIRWAEGDPDAGWRVAQSYLGSLGPARLEHLRTDLAAALGDEPARADPAPVADVLWQDALSAWVPSPTDPPADEWDEHAFEVGVAILSGMRRRAEADPAWRMADEVAWLAGELDGSDAPLPTAWSPGTGVTLAGLDELAGTHWETVVVAGAVEGAAPRATTPRTVFPTSFVDELPPLLVERARFDRAVHAASSAVVAVAGLGPGVLLSRYVQDWPVADAALDGPTPRPRAVARTAGPVAVSPDGTLTLSASQLATYDDCPQRYAFQYPGGARVRPGVWADVGTYLHAVLAGFVEADGRQWEDVEAQMRIHWDDGLADFAPQREEIRRDAADILRRWWEREWAGDTSPDVIAVEHPFSFGVGRHTVAGRIDRVDRVPEGLAVIDYKTGSRLPPAGDVVDDIQLAIYHLAAVSDPALAAAGPPVALQLRYLRSGVDIAQPITEDHAARTRARVLAVAERILAEDFAPSPDADCDTCPFRRACPLQPEGRAVAAR